MIIPGYEDIDNNVYLNEFHTQFMAEWRNQWLAMANVHSDADVKKK